MSVRQLAKERSLKARQTQPSESTLALSDEYHAKHAVISKDYPMRKQVAPTVRGFNASNFVGVRQAPSGESALGDYVRCQSYSVKASPAVRYTDNDTKDIQEAQIDPPFTKKGDSNMNLEAPVEYQSQGVTIGPVGSLQS